jgi:large subunit ribosomal protein L6
MSKIGKQPIKIPEGVEVKLTENEVNIKGPKGELKIPKLSGVEVKVENNFILLSLLEKNKQSKSNWGTLRSLIQNAVTGVVHPFEKTLILEGIGYRISKEGNDLNLSLGFSHPVIYKAPAGITFEVEKNSILKVIGINKALVGEVAAEIRSLKKPEPYKGKGFRYASETIRRKEGKKAATSAS